MPWTRSGPLPMREDQVKTSFSSKQALANAPDSRDEYFRVPAVIE